MAVRVGCTYKRQEKDVHLYEPAHNKTNKMACAHNEDSDQSGHPSRLIRVYARRTCHFVRFAMRGLICLLFLHCHFSSFSSVPLLVVLFLFSFCE